MANSKAFGKVTPLQIRTLLREARGGSNEALGQLFAAFQPFLAYIADAKIDCALKRKESKSDLVQLTFLEAQKGFDGFRGSSSDELAAWLRRILLNNLGDSYKRFQRSAKRNIGREQSIDDEDIQLFLNRIAVALDPSPSETAAQKEEFLRIRMGIEQLRPEYRQVLLWRHRNQWSVQTIARHLERSTDAVRMLLNRALKKLHAELTREKTSA